MTAAQRAHALLVTFLACAVLFVAPGALAQVAAEAPPPVSEAFRQAVRSFLEIQGTYLAYADTVAYGAANETLMGFAANGIEVTEQMQQVVLEESQARFGDKFRDMDYLTEVIAPVYAKYFTQADMEAMIAFWSSPVGRKNLEVTAAMNQDTMQAIQQVTLGIAPAFQLAVDARLRELGYELAPSGAPGAPATP